MAVLRLLRMCSFKHLYFEEQRTALKAPEGLIFDPRVPVLELFLPFIMLEEFLDHITSQPRRQFKTWFNLLLFINTSVGDLSAAVKEEEIEVWKNLHDFVTEIAATMKHSMITMVLEMPLAILTIT